MLNNNIRTARKNKGMSQEELASRLNVVRQTISKWESGRSVPDSEMLVKLSEELETSVSALLGNDILPAGHTASITELSEKLETVNATLAKQQERKRKVRRAISIAILIGMIIYCIRDATTLLTTPEIIGGADVPAGIWVVSPPVKPIELMIGLLLLSLSLLGIVYTRKK